MSDTSGEKRTEGSGGPLRETVTSVIALSVVGVGLWMLVETFLAGGGLSGGADGTGFNNRKEILAIAIGLLGTVLGYYFGRVPAERQADAARADAASAKEDAADAEARANDLAERQTRALATLEAAGTRSELESAAASTPGGAAIQQAIAELRSGPRR
jgi:type VI protein secretion system component VasK